MLMLPRRLCQRHSEVRPFHVHTGHYDAQKGQRIGVQWGTLRRSLTPRGAVENSPEISHAPNPLLWHACPVPGVIETLFLPKSLKRAQFIN